MFLQHSTLMNSFSFYFVGQKFRFKNFSVPWSILCAPTPCCDSSPLSLADSADVFFGYGFSLKKKRKNRMINWLRYPSRFQICANLSRSKGCLSLLLECLWSHLGSQNMSAALIHSGFDYLKSQTTQPTQKHSATHHRFIEITEISDCAGKTKATNIAFFPGRSTGCASFGNAKGSHFAKDLPSRHTFRCLALGFFRWYL